MLKRMRSEGEVSTLRWLISVWAAAALLVGPVGAAQASPPTAASGTFTQTTITSLDVRFAGPNIIIEQTTQGSVSGTLTGTFEDAIRAAIHPNGKFTATSTSTCVCTVDGQEGVLELIVVDIGEGVGPASPTFAGHMVITGATGELSGLRGVFEVEGTVDIPSGLSTWTYAGHIHFHP